MKCSITILKIFKPTFYERREYYQFYYDYNFLKGKAKEVYDLKKQRDSSKEGSGIYNGLKEKET